jgi:hypothetical protein
MSDPRDQFTRPTQPVRPPAVPAVPASLAVPAVPAVPARPVAAPPVAPPRPTAQPASPTSPAPAADDYDLYDDEEEPPTMPTMLIDRIRSLSPAFVILTGGSLGSLIFLLLAMTSHTTPVAVLMSAGAVTGMIFGVDSVISSIFMWRAGQDGRLLRALLLSLIAGIACVVSFAAFAGVLVLALLLS